MSLKNTVENVYIRQRAVQLTRKCFWVLLGMTLISAAINNGLSWLLTQLGDAWLAPEITVMTDAFRQYLNAQTLTSTTPVTDAALALFTSPKFWCINALHFVVTGLVSTGITLGGTLQFIEAGRGNKPRIAGMFSRMRHCLKAWGLSLWLMVKIILWLLPGIVLMFTGGVLQAYDQPTLSNWVIIAGFMLLTWLLFAALLRYAQAVHILADEPHRGIRESVRLSKGMMKHRQWQFIRLCTPAFLKGLGLYLLTDIVCSMLLSLLSLDANDYAAMAASLLCSLSMMYHLIQLDIVCALFYLRRQDADFPIAPAHVDITSVLSKPEVISDKPVSAWLEEHAADIPPEEKSDETTEEKEKENPDEEPDC